MRKKIQTCLFLLMSGIFFIALASCEKDPINNPDNPGSTDTPTPDNPTVGEDLVDLAFRDLVGTFGLDTVGRTKTLQMSYPFNEGDYMVDNFEPQTKQDTMYAKGVYHYTGSDESIPRETPYRVMWTRSTLETDGLDGVKLEYDYGNKDTEHWPTPNTMYLLPGEEGDNKMQMQVTQPEYGAAYEQADITGNNAECMALTTDYIEYSFSNPFNVNITANYPKP